MQLMVLFLLISSMGRAQTIVPLLELEQLREGKRQQELNARIVCGDEELPGIERLINGQSRTLRIDLDTVGLGSDLNDYRCIGCIDLNFGSVTINSDTVSYTANSGVEQGLDTIGLTVCSAATEVCADTVELVVLVQRPGRIIELGDRVILPGARVPATVPDAMLPGGTFCRTISSCATDYAGRGQVSYFDRGPEQSNDFTYDAARYGGTDTVCVKICNEYGLCDTYRSSFTVERQVTELPFFDDFSYAGTRPASALWQDQDVLINRNYATTPPSLGVATFDAVNFSGQAYPAGGNVRKSVSRDFLTSNPVNLEGKVGTVLSFFLQPKGLGNRPEVQDSFLVQFLDRGGDWTTVFAREGLLNTVSNTVESPFTGYSVAVPANYAYRGFQFRFVNLSAEQGAVDNWNLDYVKLSDRSTTLVTQDLALTEVPFRLLAPYTSLPVRHLQAAGQELLADSIRLGLWNHRADITPVTGSRYVIENLGGPAFRSEGGLFPSAYLGQDNGIAPQTSELRNAAFEQLPTYEQVRAFLFDLDPEQDYTFATTFVLTVATEDATFDPAVVRNNTARQLTVLDDYFAYDDGSAEVAIEGQRNNVIVQRYTAFVADRLTGIRIRLPRGLGGVGDQLLNLVVYAAAEDGLPGELLYSAEEPILYAEDVFVDSLQAFTSYAVEGEVDLPVGDFFVGWKQPTANRSLPVGFDRNNQPRGVQFFNAGSGWQALEGATRGAIMIRPLLAGAEVLPTGTGDRHLAGNEVEVFPNPTTGRVTLRSSAVEAGGMLTYRVFGANGQLRLIGTGSTIDLGAFPAGMYMIEWRMGKVVSRHKLIKR